MGTYYSMGNTKKQEVESIISDCAANGNKALNHSLRGNCLWILLDCKGTNIILLYLMQAPPRSESGWGYRPYDESAHPYYYSCPLSYLAAAPVACQKWRDNVIEWHAKQKDRRNKKFKVGETYKVPSNWKIGNKEIGEVLITSVSPLRGWVTWAAGNVNIKGKLKDSLELVSSPVPKIVQWARQ
jgi:hypothetical protein